MNEEKARELFEKYAKKLRISPQWDVKLEFVRDPSGEKRAISRSTATIERRFCF